VASRFRRVALAVAGLLVAALPLSPTVARAGLDASADPSCPAARGLPTVTRTAIDYTGSLQCFRPGAQSFTSTASRAPETQRLDQPTQGAPCANITYNPVSFSESNQGIVKASYSFMGGTNGASVGLQPDEMVKAATYDALVADAQTGTYQPVNPSDPASALHCNLDPGFKDYCPTGGGIGTFCYIWVLHGITPGTAPIPAIAPYLGDVVKSIHAGGGTIGSAPSQTGVVNTKQCFWIDGMGIPAERDLVLIVPSNADASGRQIFYTFLVRIQYQGVEWHFDDPFSNVEVQPPPDCSGRAVMTAHYYRQISDDVNPDHRYHVTAIEHYSITAQVSWVDSDGPHPLQTVDPGVTAPAISPTGLAQYVGQVEGVPVGG
jgi:hypothetical protein